jgi:2',3'-cyclic-nucleotide 2'-phosphodiesterase (5'-nucleotidase family)
MKKFFLISCSCLSLILVSCQRPVSNSSSSISNEDSSSSVPSSSSVSKKPHTIKVASLNDLHGAIEENGNEPGLSKLSSYLKANFKSDDILLGNGDMWQGNGESNLNKGKLITEWMNLEGFDAMGIGNHDFDWGQEALKANKEVANFPFLAANVYHYENGKATDQASEIGDKSTIVAVDDIKIGIVGGIGKEQFTSITSSQVAGLDFQEPYTIFQSESDHLRSLGCDLVLGEIHASVTKNAFMDDLTANSPTYSKPYFNAIFGGHSHQKGQELNNGVPILMGEASGQEISEVTFTIGADSSVSVDKYAVVDLSPSSLTTDEATETLLNSYRSNQDPILDTKVGNAGTGFTTGYLDKSLLGRMNAKAMFSAASKVDSTIQITINNGGRNYIARGDLTFRDIYRSFPFDNSIVLMDVSSLDLLSETSGYNCFYNPSHLTKPVASSSLTYRVAVIDYLALHQNSSHDLNYFPSQNNVRILSSDEYLPRNIMKDEFNGLASFSSNDYSGTDFQYA